MRLFGFSRAKLRAAREMGRLRPVSTVEILGGCKMVFVGERGVIDV